MPIVEAGGHSFQYMEVDGEGPTVLLLCSTGLDSKQWKGLIPHLEGRRVPLPPLPLLSRNGWLEGRGRDRLLDGLPRVRSASAG